MKLHSFTSPAVLVLTGCLLVSVGMSQESGSKSSKPASGVSVTEAKLGTGVQDKMLVGESATFALNEKIFVWLKVTGGTGEDLSVVWKMGEKSYLSKLPVGGSPWRTWSFKTAATAGPGTVTILDTAGTVLKTLEFTVGGAAH